MFRGFLCELDESKVSPTDCLACSHRRQVQGLNTCHFPPPIIRGIVESSQPRALRGYSATELIGCHRKVALKDRADYWVKPSQAYWLFRGHLGHAIVERYHGDGVIAEQRFYAEVDGMLVTGQPDVVYPDDRLLVDYKTSKRVPRERKRYTCTACGAVVRENEWNARRGTTLACECGVCYEAGVEIEPEVLPPQPYDAHVAQLNVYAWLLAENNVPVDSAQVVYLDMSAPLPVPVELWPLARTDAFVRRQLALLLERDPRTGLPSGVHDDPDDDWQCEYCCVREACEASRAEETLAEGRRLLRGDGDEIEI
jgi:CRISPR/Cas system-associated exonuclease Cas4 (RecB family)